MKHRKRSNRRRATVLLMIVGLLAMLFMLVSAYITLAHFERANQNYVSEGKQTQEIVQGINDVVIDQILLTGDADVGAPVTGANYHDIPGDGGYDDDGKRWGTAWLASEAPVKNPNSATDNPADFIYPAVTSLTGTPAVTTFTDPSTDWLSVNNLCRTYTLDDYEVSVVPGSGAAKDMMDTLGNARNPWMDADADGIPDSSFVHTATATELANAVVGLSVRVGDENPTQLYANASEGTDEYRRYQQWKNFDEQGRYTAAVRVISHGGMVLMGESEQTLWNREFRRGMFNWLVHPGRYSTGGPLTIPDDPEAQYGQYDPQHPFNGDSDWIESALVAMPTQQGSIEPLLRRRNGLLLGQHGGERQSVPPALGDLQSDLRWKWTFNPNYGDWQLPLKGDNFQRFNIAAGTTGQNEWQAWYKASTLDVRAVAEMMESDQNFFSSAMARQEFVPRRHLTTVSNSDDLAREMDGEKTNRGGLYQSKTLGIDPGQPKFPLSRISEAFTGTRFNEEKGRNIIEEIAAYYHEMLSLHRWTVRQVPYEGPDGSRETEAEALRNQAFMLAVNTVAFAAPRDVNGFIDVVRYTDNVTDATYPTHKYYGYAPQPYITQVLAYNYAAPDPSGQGNEEGKTALAIELYNPNERSHDTGDQQPLFLPQFALSINDSYDPQVNNQTTGLRPLDDSHFTVLNGTWSNQMPGKSYLVLKVGEHSRMDGRPEIDAKVTNDFQLDYFENRGDEIEIKLWRSDRYPSGGTGGQGSDLSEVWHLVDQVTLKPQRSSVYEEDEKWYVSVYRDMHAGDTAAIDTGVSRWRMVMAERDPVSSGHKQGDAGDPMALHYEQLGNSRPASSSGSQPTIYRAPVPLHTMNAYPHTPVEIHGAKRPPSFPTVGFLHFVPRYCHTLTLGIPGKPYHHVCLGQWLWDMYNRSDQDGEGYTDKSYVPVDFGHMPIFDNTQDVVEHSLFDDNGHAGAIPWGLLVYDYFTTIDPNGPDGNPETTDDNVDPRCIPGRININTAPWYLLAGLPVIGPEDGLMSSGCLELADSDRDLTAGYMSPSAAFWKKHAGILHGTDTGTHFTNSRFNPGFLSASVLGPTGGTAGSMGIFYDSSVGWWRLGPYLAQAAAAYRDRVPYVQPSVVPTYAPTPGLDLAKAWQRNDNTDAQAYYRDDPKYGGDTSPSTSDSSLMGIRRNRLNAGDDNVDTEQRGFVTIGELANVMGWDSFAIKNESRGPPDFMRAVSLLALLDTHFLCTRSNTFTIYSSVMDRENPQASLRSQVTIDRGKLMPEFVWYDLNGDGIHSPEGAGGDLYTINRNTGEPEIIGQREVSYFNARYDN